MGKGNKKQSARNKRYAAKNKNSWVLPVVITLIVVFIVAVSLVDTFTGSGIIERNRVIVKSETGKYDMTQQMATYIAWLNMYEMYEANYDTFKEMYGTSIGDNAGDFALSMAATSLQSGLRDCIDDIQETLVNYVAVCDAAYNNNIALGETEKSNVDKAISALQSIKNSNENVSVLSMKTFLDLYIGNGMKEKDIRRAEEVIELYNLYRSQMEVTYEAAISLSDLETFRLENPDKYYKTDYLSFAADNKELADKLAACTTAEEFKNLILAQHFDSNYAAIVSNLVASEAYLGIEGKTNDNGTALTDALNQIGAEEKTLNKAEMTAADKALSDWLFSTDRKQYQTNLVSTDEAEYIVAFMSEGANTETVSVRIKAYKHAEIGSSWEGDDAFWTSLSQTFVASEKADALYAELNVSGADVEAILAENGATEATDVTEDSAMPKAVIKQVLQMHEKAGAVLTANENGVYYVMYLRKVEDGKADFAYCAFGSPVDKYTSARAEYDKLLETLNAEGANKKEIMTANGAVSKTGVTSSTADAVVPTNVVKAVFKDGVSAGNVYTANANDVYYVIYVDEMSEGNTVASISYVTLKGDMYYRILYSLRAGYDEDGAAAEKGTALYTPDAEEGSYLEWISEVNEEKNDKGEPVSKRQKFDTKIIESTEEEKTVYTVYMVLSTPLYLDMHSVVMGGYVLITDTNHAEVAAQIAEKIKGKTGMALEQALRKERSSATIATFSEPSLSDANLKAWMFDSARTEDEVGTVANTTGNGTYVMIHSANLLSWQAAAMDDCLAARIDGWIAGLVANGGYEANVKVLDKIGALSTTAEETTATTAPATTAA